MESVTCLCIVLAEMLCFVQAQTFEIKKEFIDGNLTFTWTNVSTRRNDIVITKDGSKSSWIQITDDKYTVEDAWKYKSVNIKVREYTSADHRSYKDYYSTYTVSRIDSQEGDTANLTFTADFIPNSGKYDIYHFYDDTSNRIIRVTSNNESSMNYSKYAYHTRPYTSTNITFEVKNITLMDAGYYGIGATEIAARSGQGVVLVVKGKPTQPEIAGILKVQETSDVTLTCSSNSTSRPSYYRKTVSLSYIWYRNNTVIDSKTRMTLGFPGISRDVRFNNYSCQAKESIVSEKSEDIQINVLYGPSSVTITPQLPVNKTVSVKDGDYIGPYHCSADCNPPCSIHWRYKLPNGTSKETESNGSSLLQQQLFKDQDKASFRCVAKSASGNKSHEDLKLYIIYLSKPTVMINGKKEENVDIREGKSLNISCSVDGNSNPTLSISRDSQEQNLKTRQSHSIGVLKQRVQCDDKDTYKCTASSPGFADNYTEVTLNVLCRTRMDIESVFKTSYGSKSGSGVTVIVKAPIISNPKPSTDNISWSGPTPANIQDEITERGAVIYKHWITSTVPVNDQRYFGNYTMTYNGEIIFTITIKAEAPPPLSSSSSDTWIVIVVGASASLVVVIVVVVVLVCVLKKRSNNQGRQRERLSDSVKVEESFQPDVVQYAVVDRSLLMRNRTRTEEEIDDATNNTNDGEDAVNTDTKMSTMTSKTGNKSRKRKSGKKTPQNDVETAAANCGNMESRTENQDGLVYIDVEFANKPECSNTKGKPVVHGEEDRTEYTFVDFSKKAPPIKEAQDDEITD